MLDVSQDNSASKVDDQDSIPNMDSSPQNLSSG
jgi:hypothetical protein